MKQDKKVAQIEERERDYNVKEDWDLRALSHPRSTYTPEQKIQVAATYVRTGNLSACERATGIHNSIISKWKNHSDWWPDLITKIRKEKQDSLDAVVTETIDKAMEQIQDRVVNGEYKLRASGEMVRVPMSGKDLTVSMAVLYDKRALIRGEATSITARKQGSLEEIENKLKEFAKFNDAKTVDITSKKKRAPKINM
jgi:transposase-like protein